MYFLLIGKKKRLRIKSQICSAGKTKAFLQRSHTSPGGEQVEIQAWCLKSYFPFQSAGHRIVPQWDYVQNQTYGTWSWETANQPMGFSNPCTTLRKIPY